MNNSEENLYKHSREVQDKFTYFLLAVAASAIAFSIEKISDKPLTISLGLLGVAILFWGISFYFGCMNIKYVASTIYANYGLVLTQNGKNKEIPNEAEYIQAATEGIKLAMENNANKAGKYSTWQFKMLIWGASAYILWQVIEIIIRSFYKL
jgi:hypothetical protein